jgi:hypothetical protein
MPLRKVSEPSTMRDEVLRMNFRRKLWELDQTLVIQDNDEPLAVRCTPISQTSAQTFELTLVLQAPAWLCSQ